jgi:hypothetical protein
MVKRIQIGARINLRTKQSPVFRERKARGVIPGVVNQPAGACKFFGSGKFVHNVSVRVEHMRFTRETTIAGVTTEREGVSELAEASDNSSVTGVKLAGGG